MLRLLTKIILATINLISINMMSTVLHLWRNILSAKHDTLLDSLCILVVDNVYIVVVLGFSHEYSREFGEHSGNEKFLITIAS